MDRALILVVLVIGLASGFLTGLLAIGGSMVLFPSLVFLLQRHGIKGDLVIKTAITTYTATSLFTSLSSIWE